MSPGGVFVAVMAEVERGSTAKAAAHRLALPLDLVETVLEEAERLGLASRYGTGCSGCPSSGRGCDGCPLTKVVRRA